MSDGAPKTASSTSVGSALARHESLEQATSLASLDQPSEAKLPPAKVYDPFSFQVLLLLAPASIFGVLARLGLQGLTTYYGRSIFPLAYVQAIGCLIMGFALEVKDPIADFYGPLYTALTTGFCGSLTTFSGWQLDIFSSWVNAGQYHRSGLFDAIDGIAKSVFTVALSLVSITFGARLGSHVKRRLPKNISRANATTRYSLTVMSVLFYAAVFPAYFRLPAQDRHKATSALLFAFPGTLTRYSLSIFLNKRSKLMPLGTLTANAFGSALLAVFHVLQSIPTPVSPNACAILQGLADGYCGCLTTISTFAAEVSALEERKAWLYASVSWLVGQSLMLVILGPSYWASGVREQVTCKFA